jgi:hypothetical protein
MPGMFTGLLHWIYLPIPLSAGRNNKSCRKRWLHSLDPNLRKGESGAILCLTLPFLILHAGRWTTEEDAALLDSVTKYGKKWYEVARALPGRTDDQCAKRYKEAVDPSISRYNCPPLLEYRPIFLAGRDPWTTEEDELLWSAFEKHGNKWHTIANTLQGRPG